jgi:hypothetical protein
MEVPTRKVRVVLRVLLSRRNSGVGMRGLMRSLLNYLKAIASDSNGRKEKY